MEGGSTDEQSVDLSARLRYSWIKWTLMSSARFTSPTRFRHESIREADRAARSRLGTIVKKARAPGAFEISGRGTVADIPPVSSKYRGGVVQKVRKILECFTRNKKRNVFKVFHKPSSCRRRP